MVEHENKSVDAVEQNALSKAEESNQSNTELEETSVRSPGLSTHVTRSPSTILGKEDDLYKKERSPSASSIDLKTSRRYPLTLEQARRRALRSIKRARERDSLLVDDDES